MKISVLFATILSMVLLTACDKRVTDYTSQIPSNQSTGWNVVDVRVHIPDTLISTEENSLAPEADIVWHGEPFGDRKQQVSAIVDNAITSAASRLTGNRAVIFDVTLLRFHALTPKARRLSGGLHKVRFTISVIDANTGEVIIAGTDIQADEFGLKGQEAQDAEAAGQTQKVRITNRIYLVVLNWLGVATESEQVVLGNISHLGK